MGICWWVEYSRFEADHKSFQSFNSFHWTEVETQMMKGLSFVQMWFLVFNLETLSFEFASPLCRLPFPSWIVCFLLVAQCGCAHHDFQLVPDGFSKITTAEHFLAAKRCAASKADHFFSTLALPAKQDRTGLWTTCRMSFFGKCSSQGLANWIDNVHIKLLIMKAKWKKKINGLEETWYI